MRNKSITAVTTHVEKQLIREQVVFTSNELLSLLQKAHDGIPSDAALELTGEQEDYALEGDEPAVVLFWHREPTHGEWATVRIAQGKQEDEDEDDEYAEYDEDDEDDEDDAASRGRRCLQCLRKLGKPHALSCLYSQKKTVFVMPKHCSSEAERASFGARCRSKPRKKRS